jgi:hypothetical protein
MTGWALCEVASHPEKRDCIEMWLSSMKLRYLSGERSDELFEMIRAEWKIFSITSVHTNRRTQMPEITIVRLLDLRPADVPSNFPIFNAPRPLIGSKQWSGAFRHGVLYAAVDITLPGAERCIRDNVSLDGWLCEYITKEDVEKWGREKAVNLNIRYEDHPYETWEESWLSQIRTEKRDLDEYLRSLFEQAVIPPG